MSEIKECGNCRHAFEYGYDKHCSLTKRQSKTTGEWFSKDCKSERIYGDCGSEAKNFSERFFHIDSPASHPPLQFMFWGFFLIFAVPGIILFLRASL